MTLRRQLIVLVILIAGQQARADEVLYAYEGDVLPYDESAGWWQGLCQGRCSESLEDGHFVLHWTEPGDGATYTYIISSDSGEPPLPPTLWVEWHFRSNHPLGPYIHGCDGRFAVRYDQVFDLLHMDGDAAISFEGGDVVYPLEIDEFHTYRFESLDGIYYQFSVDGLVFVEGVDYKTPGGAFLQMGGRGGCGGEQPNTVNRWDFVRYGTISKGEVIDTADPPLGGVLDPAQYPGLDRFTVTFDQPNYVYIDDITVEVTGGDTPVVIQTRRLENGDPETVEIVLDRPMPMGETTTFTFDDGVAVNIIEYTIGAPVCGDGVVNQPGEDCDGSDDAACRGICRKDCTCPFCGDGIVDTAEQCDDGGESATCDTDCTPAECGDGTLNVTAGEECDDGGTVDGDGCSSTCVLEGACCLPSGGCSVTTEDNCVVGLSGAFQGDTTLCQPLEACCLPGSSCQDLEPNCCAKLGGDPKGPGTGCMGIAACYFPDQTCVDIDQHCCFNQGGTPKPGESCLGVEACCLPDDTCEEIDALVCVQKDGLPQGTGSVCEQPQACCLGNACEDLEPNCCLKNGGSSQGLGTACSVPEPCCLPDHTCRPMDPLCCNGLGGKLVTACPCGACCLKDTGGECVDDAVEEECPQAALKFFPGRDCDEISCDEVSIPAVSAWGLMVLVLLLLIGHKLYFGRRVASRP